MQNKYKLLLGIIGIVVLFFLSAKLGLYETYQSPSVLSDWSEEYLSIDKGQEQSSFHTDCTYPLSKRDLSLKAVEKVARLTAVLFFFVNLFHLNGVLFLQGKGGIFVCFKSCVFYPAHFLCELFIRQKSDGKKRIFLSQ